MSKIIYVVDNNDKTEYKYNRQCVYGLTYTSETYVNELEDFDDDISDLL